jgi:CheY-like chemotaxis protein
MSLGLADTTLVAAQAVLRTAVNAAPFSVEDLHALYFIHWSHGSRGGTDENVSSPDALVSPVRPFVPTYEGCVLIADDDPDIRHSLRILLLDEGYQVEEVDDGRAALDYLRATPQRHIVLLDYRMPKMDGGELLRAVAADAHLAARHAFVLVTANLQSAPPDILDVLLELDVPIVRKPFSLEAMMQAVERAERRFD